MKVVCECNSLKCKKTIDLPLEEAQKVVGTSGLIIIIDGCQNGPELTDTQVSKEKGYTIYREVEH